MWKLAVYINVTAQRAESFRKIQEDYNLDLKMLQDVRQHWNSTYHMLVYGWQLQDALEKLTRAIREVEAVVEMLRAEHDPLVSHIFVSRRQYQNLSDTKSGKRRA